MKRFTNAIALLLLASFAAPSLVRAADVTLVSGLAGEDAYKVRGAWYYPKADATYDQEGEASWYGGPRMHGRRTASGEKMDQNALTAAHPTLPMSSLVRVTNLTNNRSVIVRINDRGPFVRGRIIELTRQGARQLGYEAQGVARVRVQVIPTDAALPQ